MHLCFAVHLVLHWLLEVHFPHSAYNYVVVDILIILPLYVDLNQQEHTSIYIDIYIYIYMQTYSYMHMCVIF